MIQDHRHEQRKNQAAESAFVRQQVWGEKTGQSVEDDMGTTILGDVTNPTPIVINSQPQQQSGGALKTLAILAAGALIPGAGIGGYLASQWLNQKPVATETEDKSLDLGLLKFEDLKEQQQ